MTSCRRRVCLEVVGTQVAGIGFGSLAPMGQSHTADDVLDLAGQVRPPTIEGLPTSYRYGVTRYADVILQEAFRGRFDDLQEALEDFRPTLDELRAGGGSRTVFVRRFDESLGAMIDEADHGDEPVDQTIWGKQNITIEKAIGFDGQTEPVSKVRGHEIDMFGKGSLTRPFPGVAVEM